MDKVTIHRLVDLTGTDAYGKALDAIRNIFFETTTRKKFDSEADRQKFFHDWTGLYFEVHLDLFYIATYQNQIVGYLEGCDDSLAAADYYRNRVESYAIFADQFNDYPAHLHINCSSDFQGLGIGQKLMEEFFEDLRDRNIRGVHIVTAADARNVNFYRRLGFKQSIEREFRGSRLRFMGKRLLT